MSTSVTGGNLEAESEGTHHCSLKNNSPAVKGRFTSVVFRIFSEGCVCRTASSRTLGRHCALDSSLGSQVSCSGDQALWGFPVFESSSPLYLVGVAEAHVVPGLSQVKMLLPD